jgi:hypothetical protein
LSVNAPIKPLPERRYLSRAGVRLANRIGKLAASIGCAGAIVSLIGIIFIPFLVLGGLLLFLAIGAFCVATFIEMFGASIPSLSKAAGIDAPDPDGSVK